MAGRTGRRWGRAAAVVVAGAVVASGIGLYATDSWPFRAGYCWGAWQQDSGASFLGEDALAKSGSERRVTESAPPSAAAPHAGCTVEVASAVPDDGSEPLEFSEKVVLEYGAVPAGAKERRAWISQYLHASASPLPDGLAGLVAGDRAMLVLPAACDVDGRPAAVTIRSEGYGDGHLGKLAMPFSVGSRSDVARMLLDAANVTVEKAGCAPAEPLRVSSPMVKVAEKSEPANDPLCRIPGVTFEFGKGSRYEEQVGVVGERLQTCSAWWVARGEPDEPAAQFVMAGEPRLTALFEGLPEGADKGLVRATCDGRPTVFYGNVEAGLKRSARPDERRVFESFVASVSRRIGCETKGDA